jgi:hypothetical protein
MAGSLEKLQAALAKADFIAIEQRDVRELCTCPRTKIDFRARAGGQLAVAGDEVGVQVRFDHVLDAQAVLASFVEVDFDVTLGSTTAAMPSEPIMYEACARQPR